MKHSVCVVGFLSFLVYSCAPMISKQEFAPKMYSHHPLTILVYLLWTNQRQLMQKNTIQPLLRSPHEQRILRIPNWSGQWCDETGGFVWYRVLHQHSPQKFREYFDADAVLYVTILEWNTSYYVTGGNVSVKISCELKSTTTGEVLWFYNDVVIVNTSGNNGGAPD